MYKAEMGNAETMVMCTHIWSHVRDTLLKIYICGNENISYRITNVLYGSHNGREVGESETNRVAKRK
jgi:hypothetical protein